MSSDTATAGLPSRVATRFPGIRRQIRRLIEDDDLAARLGAAARREALARWDAKVVMPREIEIVKEATR
mgnify:CR=1 FL=1